MLDSIYIWFKSEPTLVMAFIQATIALGLGFGWWHWSVPQTGAVIAVMTALAAMIVRSQVTPTYALENKGFK